MWHSAAVIVIIHVIAGKNTQPIQKLLSSFPSLSASDITLIAAGAVIAIVSAKIMCTSIERCVVLTDHTSKRRASSASGLIAADCVGRVKLSRPLCKVFKRHGPWW